MVVTKTTCILHKNIEKNLKDIHTIEIRYPWEEVKGNQRVLYSLTYSDSIIY